MIRLLALVTLLACLFLFVPALAQDHGHAPTAPMPASSSTPAVTPVGPAVLANTSTQAHTVEVTLTAAPTRVSLMEGRMTSVYAYNGRVPGPTLEAHEGDRVIIHFRNDLPEPTTVHWHGLHIPVTSDGSPYYPITPGRQYDYIFTLQPGSAGTYWYHPHPDHATGRQIGRGLFGAIVVRPANDPLPPLQEQLLVLSDSRLSSDGSIEWADPKSLQGGIDEENGREGNLLFVNGQITPTITIRSGEVQRWRIVNASAARVYRLALPGQTFLHVGNDGGLFERPVERNEIVVANSERVELLVRGTGPPGSRSVLQALPYDRYAPPTRPKDWNTARDLLTLQYAPDPPVAPIAVPDRLRPVPALDPATATATRVISLGQGLINGRTMDMNRVDVRAKLGATEIWTIENLVAMDHPFHLHGFQFQVLDRNGVPEPFRSWKDTVNVPKHEVVRFIVKFDDFPGRWMFHCHILDHEDHGMMGVLEVK
jgi:FtsP/CotA-like multicopper oxidase with cupredoxin domain